MLNHICLIGRLTKDPELRKTNSGMSVASFSLAVNNDRGGEKATMFIDCSAFGNAGDMVAKFLRKGSMAAVSGRLNQRKYTNRDNQQVTVFEVMADSVDFLSPKQETKEQPRKQNTPEAIYQKETAVVDDDLPF